MSIYLKELNLGRGDPPFKQYFKGLFCDLNLLKSRLFFKKNEKYFVFLVIRVLNRSKLVSFYKTNFFKLLVSEENFSSFLKFLMSFKGILCKNANEKKDPYAKNIWVLAFWYFRTNLFYQCKENISNESFQGKKNDLYRWAIEATHSKANVRLLFRRLTLDNPFYKRNNYV